MRISFNFRLKAFLLHIFISVILASVSAFIVFGVWYPSPIAKAVGVNQIFLMMLAIDTVLGPLLTLIIAKEGKKSIKFDLTVIALLQFSALSYGIYNIAIARPEYIAFDTLRFELVQANMLVKEDRENAQAPYNVNHYATPVWVAVIPPKDDMERNQRTFKELKTAISPSMQPSLYEPLENQWYMVIDKKRTLTELFQFNNKADVDSVLAMYPTAIGYLPLKSQSEDMAILIDKDSIIGIVDLRPW